MTYSIMPKWIKSLKLVWRSYLKKTQSNELYKMEFIINLWVYFYFANTQWRRYALIIHRGVVIGCTDELLILKGYDVSYNIDHQLFWNSYSPSFGLYACWRTVAFNIKFVFLWYFHVFLGIFLIQQPGR